MKKIKLSEQVTVGGWKCSGTLAARIILFTTKTPASKFTRGFAVSDAKWHVVVRLGNWIFLQWIYDGLRFPVFGMVQAHLQPPTICFTSAKRHKATAKHDEILLRTMDETPEDQHSEPEGLNRCTHSPSPPKKMGVSKNRGTPKWMVYNGKPY